MSSVSRLSSHFLDRARHFCSRPHTRRLISFTEFRMFEGLLCTPDAVNQLAFKLFDVENVGKISFGTVKRLCVCACACVRVRVCVCLCVFVCLCARACTCMCVSTCTLTYIFFFCSGQPTLKRLFAPLSFTKTFRLILIHLS